MFSTVHFERRPRRCFAFVLWTMLLACCSLALHCHAKSIRSPSNRLLSSELLVEDVWTLTTSTRTNANVTTFQLVCGDASTVWMLDGDEGSVRVSRDSALTFTRVSSLEHRVDRLFVNPFHPQHVIAYDQKSGQMSKSRDNGLSFARSMPLVLDTIEFNEDPDVLFAHYRSQQQDTSFWTSVDFGHNWHLVANAMAKWRRHAAPLPYIYFVEETANGDGGGEKQQQQHTSLVQFDLFKLKRKSLDNWRQLVLARDHIVDFQAVNDLIFVTSRRQQVSYFVHQPLSCILY